MTANGTLAQAEAPAATRSGPLPGARTALCLLLAINLFNYIDRQVLAAVEPEIRKELLPDDPRAEWWMGWLSSAFLITYMLIAPLFGWLADRTSRWLLVGIGVGIWSLASGGSGLEWREWGLPLATAYWLLLLTRCFVGVGEGAYGPVAPTMIADFYPQRERGRVLSWFYLAIPVGGALGYAFGEFIVKTVELTWNWAFYLVVPPGLLLALLCFFMREPSRGQADAGAVHRPARPGDYLSLLHIPSYVLNTLGMTGMCFAMGGLAFWMPAFLEEHQAQAFAGIGPRTLFGVLTALSGLVATLLGGIAGDRLRDRYPGSYFLVSGGAMLLGFPMVLLAVWVPFPWAWLFIALAVFCLFFNTGPTNTILANVTHPAVRASGFAMNILVIHLFGDVISPPIIGGLAGWSREHWPGHPSLDAGFVVVSAMMLVSGVFWLWGARHLERDTALAPLRLNEGVAAP